ncbi:MAG: hypothetical protein KGL39_41620, partial [Patescibacteria group bacterium]|nr:hypothetical protein [Patescibacteria group bacterium]
MKLLVKQNATSVLAEVFAQNSSVSTGAGLAGLLYNSSGITAYYHRQGDSSSTAISLATMTLGTWASGGFVNVDNTNMVGLNQVGLPNACFTALGDVTVYIYGATNLAPIVLEFQVVAFDPADGVHLGLSCLPNTACTSNASLITSGSGTDQLTVTGGLASSDAKKINAVSTSSVTTINANIGTTQPTNFTGTGTSALVKSDMQDIAGSAVSTSTAQIGVNVVQINAVSTSSVAAVNANVGTTQPVNFDGTGTSAYVKSDVTEWGNSAVGSIPPDAVFIRGGTAQAGGSNTITLDSGASAVN